MSRRERIEDLGRIYEKLFIMHEEIDYLLTYNPTYEDFKKRYGIMGVETDEFDDDDFKKIPAYCLYLQLNQLQETLSYCLSIASGDDEKE